MTNQMQYLTEIIRQDDKYFFRFEVPVTETFQYTHPVYTNAKSMINKTGISQNLKGLSTATKTIIKDSKIEVDCEDARMISMMAKEADMIDRFENFESVNGWTIYIKGN